jgi:hypothetical protein
MLFGPPLIGALGAEKLDRSDGGYIGGGLGANGALSAFGPVGMLAGKLLGEVLFADVFPLPLRGPNDGRAPLGDASLGVYWGRVALEKDGDAWARNVA